MELFFRVLGYCVVGLVAMATGSVIARRNSSPPLARYLRRHFGRIKPSSLAVTQREFPARMRVDLQHALDEFLAQHATIQETLGISMEDPYAGINLSTLLTHNKSAGVLPLQFDEIDIGELAPARCESNSLRLITSGGNKYAVLVSQVFHYNGTSTTRVDIAAPRNETAEKLTKEFFEALEAAVKHARSYRGKVLSLEPGDSYTGQSTGIKVHQIQSVDRERLVLPPEMLAILERNTVDFIRHRPRLLELGQSSRKGLLFYGPPGNGKTHTIHYLIHLLQGHTTLLVSGEQLGAIGEYMSLARLLQPSIIVLEDVDLIALDRAQMNNPCQESLLNKLLNEMDGLKQDAELLFILTTNRPEALEEALSNRPGRIDQAIEFPPPDDVGRRMLIRLYANAVTVPENVIDGIVDRTAGVSAAFVKELMRRAIQFHLSRSDSSVLAFEDVEDALEELVLSTGMFNRRILGFREAGGNGRCETDAVRPRTTRQQAD
jgi:cell division protease FtsH